MPPKRNPKAQPKRPPPQQEEERPASLMDVVEELEEEVERVPKPAPKRRAKRGSKKVTREEMINKFDEALSKYTLPTEEEDNKYREIMQAAHDEIMGLRTNYERAIGKRRPKNPAASAKSRTQSGLTCPIRISREFCEWAGWDPEELHSRNEMSAKINEYVKAHNLQSTKNGTIIIIDEDNEEAMELAQLLRYDPDKDGPLNFGTFRKFMEVHCTKKGQPIPPVEMEENE